MPVDSRRIRMGAAARRKSILDAALPEFAREGYERTRVADIAAKIGVTEPVVFQNFSTKAGLFGAVLELAADQLASHLGRLSEHARSAGDLIQALLANDHQDRLHSSGELGVIFADANANSDPLIRRSMRRAHVRTLNAIASMIRRGQAEGSIRRDADPEAVAGMLLSQIHARQFRRRHARTSEPLEEAVAEGILNALRA